MTWYKLLQDQGSFVGGVFALFAGLVAYLGAMRAARLQVRAMRDQAAVARRAADDQIAAADRQTAAAREQAEQATRLAERQQCTERRALIFALAIEAPRIHRLARDRLLVGQIKYGDRPADTVERDVIPFTIDAGGILRSAPVLALQYEKVSGAAANLYNMVEIINSALMSAGRMGMLKVDALFGHLNNVIAAAETLRKELENVETTAE
jgi:hypothetical protein